jgi:hypothetical protein
MALNMNVAARIVFVVVLVALAAYAVDLQYKRSTGSDCGLIEGALRWCWPSSTAQYSYQSRTEVRKGLVEMTGSP